VGEGGAIVGPAAIMNAVADALSPFNVRTNHLPLSPTRLVEAIEAGRGA
jgi:carbon-monoxide dehydrogenase large subunit